MAIIGDIGLLHVAGILFALFALSRVVLRFKDKNISLTELVFWCIIWGSVIGVALFPEIFVTLSRVLGIGRGVDTLLYFGMILLFYLLFRLYVKVETQQKDITKLVRMFALSEAEKKKEIQKRKEK